MAVAVEGKAALFDSAWPSAIGRGANRVAEPRCVPARRRRSDRSPPRASSDSTIPPRRAQSRPTQPALL